MSPLRMIILLGVMPGIMPSLAAPRQFEIIIESSSPYYFPASAKVPAGSPIRWDNPTGSHHTITHDGCITEDSSCAFDSGSIAPSGSFTIPGLPPGKYPYHCRIHPIMRAVLTVIDSPISPSET